MELMLSFIAFSWGICTWVQIFFAYGTAYRYAKKGGNNGVALFGWFCVFNCAALVPGLGIYLWNKTRKEEAQEGAAGDMPGSVGASRVVYVAQPTLQQVTAVPADASSASAPVIVAGSSYPIAVDGMLSGRTSSQQDVVVVGPICPSCGHVLPADSKFCEFCGTALEEKADSPQEGA